MLEPVTGLSLVLGTIALEFVLEARNVLLTETGLKLAFLADELVRPWPLSPSFCLAQSAREASVSDSPLTLALAKLSCSSTVVMRLFAMSS